MYGQKKNSLQFSYKLVHISPIMILGNSGAFLSISSWFCELTKLIFVMIPYISSTGYPPQNAKDYGYVQVANSQTIGESYSQVQRFSVNGKKSGASLIWQSLVKSFVTDTPSHCEMSLSPVVRKATKITCG